MTARVRVPLLVAAGALAVLALVWLLAYRVGPAERLDGDLFRWITTDRSHASDRLPRFFTVWMLPPLYALLLLGVVVHAARVHGAARAVLVAGTMLGANLVGQVLKHATAQDRPWATTSWGYHTVADVSWPSGHALAATVLVAGALLAVRPGRRRLVAVVGTVFALGVGLSVVRMAWHMPSDAVGGWSLGVAAGATGVVAVRAVEGLGARRRRPAAVPAQSA